MVVNILHKSPLKLPFKALAYRVEVVPKRFVSTLAPQQLNEWELASFAAAKKFCFLAELYKFIKLKLH
jgi:hypothetical protein